MDANGKIATLRPAALPRFGSVSVLARLIVTWRNRRTARQSLMRLDDHMLRDIGLDRQTANREASRRFWQD